MSALEFPCTIFKTQRQMDDYGASDQFGFKPFMTDMEATVEITGGHSESKK